MNIELLEQISNSSPSQWIGTTTENRPIYIRYGNRLLTVFVGDIGQVMEGFVDLRWVYHEEEYQGKLDDPNKISWEGVEKLTGLKYVGKEPINIT